jgi:hypothetical protein
MQSFPPKKMINLKLLVGRVPKKKRTIETPSPRTMLGPSLHELKCPSKQQDPKPCIRIFFPLDQQKYTHVRIINQNSFVFVFFYHTNRDI